MRGRSVLALAALAGVLACNAILGIEAPVVDPTLGDAAADAPVAPDAGRDASAPDTSPPDTSVTDASAPDTSAPDASAPDATDACADVDPIGSDPRNCGACGRSCLGGACLGGACQPFDIARQQPAASELALSDTDVYWTATDSMTPLVGHAPKDGRAPCIGAAAACTVAPPTTGPGALLVAPSGVYVGDAPNGRVLRYDLDLLAQPQTLVTGAGTPTDFAILGGRLYWANRGLEFVRSAPVGGGAAVALATASSGSPSPWGIATDGASLFVTGSSAGGGSLAAGLYKLDPATACAGAACVPMDATGDIPYAVTVASGWVYWSTFGGKVLRMTTAGGCPGAMACPQVVASVTQAVRGIAVDGATVYFTADDGALRRTDVAGCSGASCTVVASNLGRPGSIVQDARALYFVRSTFGTPNSGAVTVLVK